MGSALFTDGHLCPGLELGHHPWKTKTYEDYLGRRGLNKFGKKAWNKFLKQAIAQTSATFNWDTSTSAAATQKKSHSTPAPMSKSSPTKKAFSAV